MPLNSGVLLADGDILTAADLAGVSIAASLVILTGCSTAVGLATFGDDVMGLARALLTGGTNAVVVTQWDIYDGPTAELVIELHRRLRDGEPVTQALCHAQNEMRLGRLGRFGPVAPHPSCWAPLIVIGDPGH